jgi:hypothetical protein
MAGTDASARGDSRGPRPAGREYVTPVLKVYGDVAANTNTVDRLGKMDGGPANART